VPREKVMTPCPHCHQEFPAREFRTHVPNCPKNPANQSKTLLDRVNQQTLKDIGPIDPALIRKVFA